MILEKASNGELLEAEQLIENVKEQHNDELLLKLLLNWHRYHYNENQDTLIIKYLLDKGADPNSKDDDGNPIIVLARTSEMLKTIAEDSRIDIKIIGSELLFSAIGQTNYEKIDYLLNQGVDPNGQKVNNNETYTPLHFAIASSDRDEEFSIVKRLVRDPSIDLNIKNGENKTPLEYANHLGLEDVVAILEEALK